MDQFAQLLVGLMGGGLILVIPVLVKAWKQIREGQITKEDTAINRWKEISEEEHREARKAWTIVDAFRQWYHPLWAAYVRATGDDKTFPSDPAQYERHLRKVEDGKYNEESDS